MQFYLLPYLKKIWSYCCHPEVDIGMGMGNGMVRGKGMGMGMGMGIGITLESFSQQIFSSPGGSPGRAIVLPPASALAAESALAKSLKLKFFM